MQNRHTEGGFATTFSPPVAAVQTWMSGRRRFGVRLEMRTLLGRAKPTVYHFLCCWDVAVSGAGGRTPPD